MADNKQKTQSVIDVLNSKSLGADNVIDALLSSGVASLGRNSVIT